MKKEKRFLEFFKEEILNLKNPMCWIFWIIMIVITILCVVSTKSIIFTVLINFFYVLLSYKAWKEIEIRSDNEGE